MHPNYTSEDEKRFWSKVDKSGGDDACWDWIAGKEWDGYGIFSIRRISYRSNRMAWIMHNKKEIPEGEIICHRCDRPSCCNPAHLFLGTHKINAEDRETKNRGADKRGEKHPMVILTDQKVLDIRNLARQGGLSQSKIGERFGISREHARNIINRKIWKHLP